MFASLKRLAGQSFIYTAGDVLNRAMSLLLVPLYTAYLAPADYGLLAVITTLSSVLSILYLQSLESALARLHYDYRDEEERKKYYGTVWLLTTLVAVGMSLLLEVAGPSLSTLLFPDVPYLPYIRLAVWTTAITNSSFLLLRSVLRVREKP
ncbi:MAG TPA: oligosaccharide flippase family protein, partial [Anaerolineae bacterium]|nr:oligosaccharide flippase family protein [Anaerolineae bacterium]